MYDEEFNRPLDIKHLGNIFYYNNLNKNLEKEVGNFLRLNTIAPYGLKKNFQINYLLKKSSINTKN